MARRSMRAGHAIVAYDLSRDAVAAFVADGATAASSIDDLVGRLETPRAACVMVSAGEATEGMVRALADRFSSGDIVIVGATGDLAKRKLLSALYNGDGQRRRNPER